MMARLKEAFRAGRRALFALTSDERKILCLVLALALIGLCAKAWHRNRSGETRVQASENPIAR